MIRMGGMSGNTAGKTGPGPSGGGGEWYDSELALEIARGGFGALAAALGPETEVTVVTPTPEYGYAPPEREMPATRYAENGRILGLSPVVLVGGLAVGGLLLYWAFKAEE